jgi:hypothetical protein
MLPLLPKGRDTVSIRRVEGRSLELYLYEIGSEEFLTSLEGADLPEKLKQKTEMLMRHCLKPISGLL